MAQQCLPFDQIVNYTCSTEATYIGREPDGFGGYNYVMKTAQPNEPRFPYDPETGEKLGLLNEPSSENLLLWSEDFTQGSWGKNQVSAATSSVTAPDGVGVFSELIENTADNFHFIRQTKTVATVGFYSGKIFIHKLSTEQNVKVDLWNITQGALVSVTFNPQTGDIISAPPSGYRIADLGEHYLVEITGEVTGTVVALRVFFGGGASYIGDGLTNILVWGAQLEKGYPTSYIPTTDSPTVRAVTATEVSTDGMSLSQGAFFIDAIIYESKDNSIAPFWGVQSGLTTDSIIIRVNPIVGECDFLSASGGTVNADSTEVPININERNKILCAYSGNALRGFINGAKVFESNNFVPPAQKPAMTGVGLGSRMRYSVIEASQSNADFTDAEAIALTALES